jgi:D-xylose transport system permease protein
MSKTAVAESDFAADARRSVTLADSARAYLDRVKGGDMGSLPAVAGLIFLVVVFSFANDRFLSTLNLANLVTQAAAICVLAMGLIPVLLVGDIDLSAGVAGGMAACITALLIVKQDQPWFVAVIVGVFVNAILGLIIGLLVARLGIPSFVVTLAFFLALQGVTLKLIGQGGSLRVSDKVIRGLSIDNVPVAVGWALAVGAVAVYAALTLLRYRRQVAGGLQHQPLSVLVLKIAGIGAILLGATYLLNANRSLNPNFPISGIPYVLPLVGALLVFWTFIYSRTAYGRHLYAVGGNAEAARRAGINVRRIRISAFVICSSMAAISGILAASNTGKVSPSSGAGNTLLYGGKGKAQDAVVGGLVIATIANGLGLLNQASYINFLVTGGVLLLAASVDAISRRRRSAAGIG